MESELIMPNFLKTFEAMVAQFFNINLYGPSGCGKSYLLNRVFNEKNRYNYFYIKLNLSDFYSKKNIFKIVTNNLNKFLNAKSKSNAKNPLEIPNKWYDFYQSLENFRGNKIQIYFIIDSILDMDSFNYFKKEIIKLFVALKSCESMKIILISNFDITNSEIQSDYDFSSIIPIQFPVLTKEALEPIIEKVCNGKYYYQTEFNEMITSSIQNFQYNFLNLNEIIRNINENLELFCNLRTDEKMNELYEKAKFIPNTEKKKKDKKDKEREKTEDKDDDIEMKDERDKKNYDSENDEKEKENKGDKNNKEHSKHHSKSAKYEQDIYTSNYHAKKDGLKYSQDALRILIKNQTSCAPIHEMKLETFFKFKDIYIEQIKKELKEKKEQGTQKNIKKDKDDKNINPTKNLTESLSKSQKILLLASYFASEISAKNDKSIFKAKKNKTNKKINRKNNNNLGHNLKATVGIPFNVHRLIAIYQSLLSTTHLKFENDDLIVKCEIATLEKLGLIKSFSGIDGRTMDQKYITKINLELARKIAEDFDIKLDDYIKVDSID